MSNLIADLLAWYYSLWPSYGGAIILLTLTVMVLVLPLTLKGTRSMLLMQRLQPEIRKLQQQYRDDRQKLNEEMMALYRENKINPVSGCLPLLIQLPVFIFLYQVLQGLTRKGEDGTFDPRYLDHNSELYQALDVSTTMDFLGLDLARSATSVASDSFVSAIPYLLLILAVALTTYIQQKQISARSPNSDALANPTQKMLLRIMPGFFAFISLSLPAALVLYFLTSNLFRVGQQALISHTIYKPAVRDGLVPGKVDDKAIETTATEVTPDDSTTPNKPAKAIGSGATKSARSGTTKSGTAKSSTAKSSTAKSGTAKSGAAKSGTTKSGAAKAGPAKAKPAPAKARPSTAKAPEPEPKGVFGRLFGGTAGGNGAAPKSPSTSPAKPRPASGRVTPPGSRTGGSGTGKKKRK
jgi:YidC/Oxa1 family membrane protein insertase